LSVYLDSSALVKLYAPEPDSAVVNMASFARSLVVAVLFLSPAMHVAQSKRPDLPFFDWNACPFEGCVYRQWTARGPVVVYDTWKRTRREAAHLSTGDSVLAVTGVVITYRPGIIRMNHDMPEQGLRRGNLI
jgi:hypothetical protein